MKNPPDALVLAGLAIGAIIVLSKATIGASSSGLQAFAQAIAGAEGWQAGSAGTPLNNPGDITDGQGNFLSFATANDGWQYLYNFLTQISINNPSYVGLGYSADMTIAQMARVYTATDQGPWASNVAAFLREQGYPAASVDSPISTWIG